MENFFHKLMNSWKKLILWCLIPAVNLFPVLWWWKLGYGTNPAPMAIPPCTYCRSVGWWRSTGASVMDAEGMYLAWQSSMTLSATRMLCWMMQQVVLRGTSFKCAAGWVHPGTAMCPSGLQRLSPHPSYRLPTQIDKTNTNWHNWHSTNVQQRLESYPQGIH
jgi:hypothetical protein